MISLFLPLAISSSGWFTYGDISKEAKNYSFATYWTLEHKKHYLLFGYDNFSEETPSWKVRQHLFSIGYAKELLHLIGIRGVGFYISDSEHNESKILSTRLLYGYNPIVSICYAVNYYSKNWIGTKNYYTVYQINPDCRYLIFNRLWVNVGLSFVNAGGEKYLSISSSLMTKIFHRFSIEIGGMYGDRVYYVDDRLLIVNNRPNIEKKRGGIKLNYKLTNIMDLLVDIEGHSFNRYDITYYAIGLRLGI